MRSLADLPHLRPGRNQPPGTEAATEEMMAILDERAQEALARVRAQYPSHAPTSVILRDCLVRAANAQHDARVDVVSRGGGRHQALYLCAQSLAASRVIGERVGGPERGRFSRALRYAVLVAAKRLRKTDAATVAA